MEGSPAITTRHEGKPMYPTTLPRLRLQLLSLATFFTGRFDRRGLRRTRRRLAELDDHLLRDIGVSRAEALTEANRKGWDAPDHWYR